MCEINIENMSDEEFDRITKEWRQTPNWLNEMVEYMDKNWKEPE